MMGVAHVSDTAPANPCIRSELPVENPIPDCLDALLTRQRLADALTAAGFPVAKATLATKATRGGGPMFQSFGRIPLYRWGDALDWCQGRMSAPRVSTSDTEAVRKAAA